MVVYGLRLSVMEEYIRMEFPGFLQLWYMDDFIMSGACANLLPDIAIIEELGSAPGFYLESNKSQFLRDPGVT